MTAAAVLSATAVLLAAALTDEHPPANDPTLGQVVNVGVLDGQSIPEYLRASKDELARLAASTPGSEPLPVYALISLTAYLAPHRLAPVLDGATAAQVVARVPLPGSQTEIVRIPVLHVPADVVTGMAEVAARKAREAAEYDRRADLVDGDGDSERRLREVYRAGARRAAAEAAAYRGHCSCIYAVVVHASPAALTRIAARPEVRAVDPAPDVRRLDRTVFRPPLPEQHDLVRPPEDDAIRPD